MSIDAIFVQALNGLTLSAILMLIAIGLTIIFGLMDVVNFAHGAFYMGGAYLAATLVARTGQFWLALVVAPLVIGGLGWAVERFLIRRLYGGDPLRQVLLTFGVAVLLREVVEIIWGPAVQALQTPAPLAGSLDLFGVQYPAYRIAVVLVAFAITGAVWLVLQRTNIGLIVRAGAYDRDMVDALGVNVRHIFTIVFIAGTMLAAIAGVLVGPLRSVQPDMGSDIIVDAFIVVIVGGLGTVSGAVAGAFLVGMAELLGVLVLPGMEKSVVYVMVALVMIFKPTGLFGAKGVAR
jgi:branched-subunit amino acid ABC-type transport system permease component